ncbi:iron chaperone [Nocardia sp. NPDC056100]|uniref:iron chaperone n=1 Tax=Nocardia sp. NPDC056100 TaxID=3345712 RepID=UPI0035DA16B2
MAATKKSYEGFSAEEREAMKDRAKELKAASGRGKKDPLADVLATIAEMPAADRVLAERVHAVITENAPALTAKLWYGQPAYALNGKVVCFFQAAAKFKTRYATLGFSDEAKIDDGSMWPTAFGLTKLTAADEKRLAELVRKAVG